MTECSGSTLGAEFFSFCASVRGGRSSIKLDIWDVGGRKRYSSLAPTYYRSASSALVVYDIGDRSTFDSAREWLHELQDNAKATLLMLVGNKVDRVRERKEPRAVSVQEACEVSEAYGAVSYTEVSAYTGEGVNECFMRIAQELDSRNSA